MATEHIISNFLELKCKIEETNHVAQLTLKQAGLISARRVGFCPVSEAMQYMFGAAVNIINWKKLFGKHYQRIAKIAFTLKGYFETDATAWVNLLDTLHDDLLDTLFTNETGAIGMYMHGNIGGVLNSKRSRFAVKYPQTFDTFKEVHNKRLESLLSHSKTRDTGRYTNYIPHYYIKDVKPRLVKAYKEIWSRQS